MKFLVACHWPLILTPTNAQIELMNVISKEQKITDLEYFYHATDPLGPRCSNAATVQQAKLGPRTLNNLHLIFNDIQPFFTVCYVTT